MRDRVASVYHANDDDGDLLHHACDGITHSRDCTEEVEDDERL